LARILPDMAFPSWLVFLAMAIVFASAFAGLAVQLTGNAVADNAIARGLNGIVYPSVRHSGGTCIAALLPHAVQSVAPGGLYRFEWSGSPDPTIARISE